MRMRHGVAHRGLCAFALIGRGRHVCTACTAKSLTATGMLFIGTHLTGSGPDLGDLLVAPSAASLHMQPLHRIFPRADRTTGFPPGLRSEQGLASHALSHPECSKRLAT